MYVDADGKGIVVLKEVVSHDLVYFYDETNDLAGIASASNGVISRVHIIIIVERMENWSNNYGVFMSFSHADNFSTFNWGVIAYFITLIITIRINHGSENLEIIEIRWNAILDDSLVVVMVDF